MTAIFKDVNQGTRYYRFMKKQRLKISCYCPFNKQMKFSFMYIMSFTWTCILDCLFRAVSVRSLHATRYPWRTYLLYPYKHYTGPVPMYLYSCVLYQPCAWSDPFTGKGYTDTFNWKREPCFNSNICSELTCVHITSHHICIL